jgi:hypothetical protein
MVKRSCVSKNYQINFSGDEKRRNQRERARDFNLKQYKSPGRAFCRKREEGIAKRF